MNHMGLWVPEFKESNGTGIIGVSEFWGFRVLWFNGSKGTMVQWFLGYCGSRGLGVLWFKGSCGTVVQGFLGYCGSRNLGVLWFKGY
jgi:hypothetical protein